MPHISEILAKAVQTPTDGCKTSDGETTILSRLETQVKTPEVNQKLAVSNAPQRLPALSESNESKDKLDGLLMGCFTLQKIYGKEPESYPIINNLFHSLLAKYPAQKVIKAVEIWLERSQEFPTPADIIGLIKRKGKPPLKESDVIAIRKKDGQDRTKAEWDVLEAWDEQQAEGWRDELDPKKEEATLTENLRLRQRIKDLEVEASRAWDEVKKLRIERVIEKPATSLTEKIQRTVDAMKTAGAPQADIDQFLQGIAA